MVATSVGAGRELTPSGNDFETSRGLSPSGDGSTSGVEEGDEATTLLLLVPPVPCHAFHEVTEESRGGLLTGGWAVHIPHGA